VNSILNDKIGRYNVKLPGNDNCIDSQKMMSKSTVITTLQPSHCILVNSSPNQFNNIAVNQKMDQSIDSERIVHERQRVADTIWTQCQPTEYKAENMNDIHFSPQSISTEHNRYTTSSSNEGRDIAQKPTLNKKIYFDVNEKYVLEPNDVGLQDDGTVKDQYKMTKTSSPRLLSSTFIEMKFDKCTARQPLFVQDNNKVMIFQKDSNNINGYQSDDYVVFNNDTIIPTISCIQNDEETFDRLLKFTDTYYCNNNTNKRT
jgi:hypothetical protein